MLSRKVKYDAYQVLKPGVLNRILKPVSCEFQHSERHEPLPFDFSFIASFGKLLPRLHEQLNNVFLVQFYRGEDGCWKFASSAKVIHCVEDSQDVWALRQLLAGSEKLNVAGALLSARRIVVIILEGITYERLVPFESF